MVRIDINIKAPQGMAQKHLSSQEMLRFLITEDDALNNLIILGAGGPHLVTTDKDVYEALASITKYDSFRVQKLAKLFERVAVFPYTQVTGEAKPILTHEKMEEIRKEALKNAKKE